jgi:hypothetical protein
MGAAGLFAHERVELLDGTIVTMSAQSSPHAAAAQRYRREREVADGAVVEGPKGTSLAVADVLPVS